MGWLFKSREEKRKAALEKYQRLYHNLLLLNGRIRDEEKNKQFAMSAKNVREIGVIQLRINKLVM